MEEFRLRSNPKKWDNIPPIRVGPSYYNLILSLKKSTGISMANIVEQCIDFALSNSGPWGAALLNQATGVIEPVNERKPRMRCPLLDEEVD